MGVKMMVEILDHWRDAGLTPGERDDLMVIAENANDGDRKTRGSIHADFILKRAGKKDVSWRNSINALMRKGVLEHAVDQYGRQVVGRLGQHAKYRIRVLCPESPHDGYKGQCTRIVESVTSQVTQEERVTSEVTQEGHLRGDPSNCLGHPTGDVCVTPEVTPTPLYPSFENSPQASPSSPSEPPDWVPPADAEGEEVQEEGEGSKIEDEVQKRAAVFVEHLPFDRHPGRRRRQGLQAAVSQALTIGWSEDELMQVCVVGLATANDRIAVWMSRLDPEELGPAPKAEQDDSEADSKPAWVPNPRRDPDGHQTWRDPDSHAYRAPKGRHQGWKNPTDPDAYEGTF